jgi:hypothetical protein
MAIDFYLLDDKSHRNLIFQLEENDLSIIEDALIKLQKLTGVVIDAYGKTTMYPDHVKLWLKLLEELELDNKRNKDGHYSRIMSLKEFLRMVSKNGEGLLIIGD